ncbi:hypothetical protein PGT21_016934 [Puccinia graminis f. sp. tritici]|uniref:Uncharacterized protein n=1 Tax=Puccinia graminis f. sp. tritici TaxID=56615 RepID=A0A5B0MU13_PUCGR|nr:hypothetical protein PGT21_016934 [Puccinia graminis f. sp. tritici]
MTTFASSSTHGLGKPLPEKDLNSLPSTMDSKHSTPHVSSEPNLTLWDDFWSGNDSNISELLDSWRRLDSTLDSSQEENQDVSFSSSSLKTPCQIDIDKNFLPVQELDIKKGKMVHSEDWIKFLNDPTTNEVISPKTVQNESSSNLQPNTWEVLYLENHQNLPGMINSWRNFEVDLQTVQDKNKKFVSSLSLLPTPNQNHIKKQFFISGEVERNIESLNYDKHLTEIPHNPASKDVIGPSPSTTQFYKTFSTSDFLISLNSKNRSRFGNHATDGQLKRRRVSLEKVENHEDKPFSFLEASTNLNSGKLTSSDNPNSAKSIMEHNSLAHENTMLPHPEKDNLFKEDQNLVGILDSWESLKAKFKAIYKGRSSTNVASSYIERVDPPMHSMGHSLMCSVTESNQEKVEHDKSLNSREEQSHHPKCKDDFEPIYHRNADSINS